MEEGGKVKGLNRIIIMFSNIRNFSHLCDLIMSQIFIYLDRYSQSFSHDPFISLRKE